MNTITNQIEKKWGKVRKHPPHPLHFEYYVGYLWRLLLLLGMLLFVNIPFFFFIIVEVLSLWLLLFKRKCVLRWFPAMALLVVCLAKKENGVDFRMAANRWRRLWPGFVASFDRFRFPISMELRWRFFDGFSGMILWNGGSREGCRKILRDSWGFFEIFKDSRGFFEILKDSLRFLKILEDALRF